MMSRFPGLDLTDEARSQTEGPAPLSPGRPGGHAPFAGPVARPVPVLAQRDLQAAVDGVVNLVALGESRLGRPNPSDIAAAHRLLRGSTIFRQFLQTGEPARAWSGGYEGDRYRAWIAWNARAEAHLIAMLHRRGVRWDAYTADDVILALLDEVAARGRLPQVISQLSDGVRDYIDSLVAQRPEVESSEPPSLSPAMSHVSPADVEPFAVGRGPGRVDHLPRRAPGVEPRGAARRDREETRRPGLRNAAALARDVAKPSMNTTSSQPCWTGSDGGPLGPCAATLLDNASVDPTSPDPVAMSEPGPSGGRGILGTLGGLDPRHVELASWMDPSNPCYGIDPAYLFASAGRPPGGLSAAEWSQAKQSWMLMQQALKAHDYLLAKHSESPGSGPLHEATKVHVEVNHLMASMNERIVDSIFKGKASEKEYLDYKKWLLSKKAPIHFPLIPEGERLPPTTLSDTPWLNGPSTYPKSPEAHKDGKLDASEIEDLTPGSSGETPTPDDIGIAPCWDVAVASVVDCLALFALAADGDSRVECRRSERSAPLDCEPETPGCLSVVRCECVAGPSPSTDADSGGGDAGHGEPAHRLRVDGCAPECSGLANMLQLGLDGALGVDCSDCPPREESDVRAEGIPAFCEGLTPSSPLFLEFGCAVVDPVADSMGLVMHGLPA